MNIALAPAMDRRQLPPQPVAPDAASPASFATLLQLAAQICEVPIATILLVDEELPWFQTNVEPPLVDAVRAIAYDYQKSQYPLPHSVSDRHADAAQARNAPPNLPLLYELPIRFYTDVPLFAVTGMVIGRLAVMDYSPRTLTLHQLELLTALARQGETQLALVKHGRLLETELAESKYSYTAAQQLNQQLHDTVRQDLAQRIMLDQQAEWHESLRQIASRMGHLGGWVFELQTKTITWSDEVCAIYEVPPGYSPTVDQAAAYYAPAWRERLQQLVARCITQGISYDVELEIVTATGRQIWARVIGEPQRNRAGMIVGIQGILQDISAQRAAAEHTSQLAKSLADTFENMTDAFCLINRSWKFAYLNQQAEKVFRCARENLLQRPVWEMFPLATESYVSALYERVTTNAEAFHLEFFYEPLENWFEVHAYPSVEGLAVYFRVITERKQVEAELRASEERFRVLSNATNDAIWDWDLATGDLWWSAGFEKLFGFPRGKIESTVDWWCRHIHPADQARVIDHIYQVIDSGALSWSEEYQFLRQDGSFAHVLDIGQVIHDAEGKPLRMIGGMTDVTARKLAEAQLREQAALLDKAQDAILVRDLDHRITYWNRSAEQLYGWPASEIMGHSVKELIYAHDHTAFDNAMQQLLTTGEWTGELTQSTKDQQQLIVEGRWTLVRDDGGNPRSILAINTNITERKQLEGQFLRAQRLESIGTLAGGIAHDLNNVLAPILLSITLLKQRAQTAEDITRLDRLQASVQRGADMVRQILSFARGVEGQRVALHLGDIVKEIEKLVCDTFEPNIRTVTAIDPHLWSIAGDPTQIHQILLNLCVNARDAMPHGGQLQLSVANVVLDARYVGTEAQTKPGCYVLVCVADRGSGIPAAIRERIFDPFFTTKEIGKGTGLGLSTVQAIVKSHGGFIDLHSAEGRGTIFKIYFPVLEGIAASNEVLSAAKTPRGHGELILVVDDDATVRMITQQTLEAFGYRVLVAADGAEALARYVHHSTEIAAILIDMMMPVMDGIATIETLLQIKPGLKIMAASGLSTNSMVTKATNAGVTHFLQKPYIAEIMLKTLALMLAE